MTDEQYEDALRRICELMEMPDMMPDQGAEFDRLIAETENYERINYPIRGNEL
jgi:hypothetical protein